MELFLIDAIGPFFRNYPIARINWSKIPFDHLDLSENRESQWRQIREDMREFAQKVSAIGYNAVTLDDLAHLAQHPFYEKEIQQNISVYREEYQKLFDILKEYGLKIYITQDVISYTPALRERLGNDPQKATEFLKELIDMFFRDFTEVSGLILRIGESDGLDVDGDFQSDLILRHAAQVRRMLEQLLPVFEKHGRKLIFRTWTVGAYSIGDLMWHRRTLARAVKGITSPALILSMKYGESDFFRYLPLNRNFFGTNLPKIVELQTRREYEGCGEYPSFVGLDYERYATELQDAENVVGISVWCQTGGWLPFRRLAFIEEEAIWTRINTIVTLRIFKHGELVEEAVRHCAEAIDCKDHESLLELLRLSDQVVNELLYLSDFAEENLFFRRVRIPPLIGVYWNTIFINHSVRNILRHFVRDHDLAVREASQALRKIERMRDLAKEAGVPEHDIEFMHRTFEILALAREFYLFPDTPDIREQLQSAVETYNERYPHGSRHRYRVELDMDRFWVSPRFVNWVIKLAARKHPGYRIIDQVLMLHALSFVYRFIRKRRPHWIPEFARKSAMGIDAIFR